jgi:hypothetical protein
VTLPGLGDLAPPHRHVPVGRWVLTVLVVVLLAGGGYAAFLGLSGGSSKSSSGLPFCPVTTHVPATKSAGPLRLTIKNATEREGLAAAVRTQLRKRGFRVISIGNAAELMSSGVAKVRYSADRRLVADHVAAQIKGGATLVPAGGHGVVALYLGPKFSRLATLLQARLAYLRLVPSPTASPVPTTSCRPRTDQESPGG